MFFYLLTMCYVQFNEYNLNKKVKNCIIQLELFIILLIILDNINGELQLLQNNTNLSENPAQITYVSTHLETVHKIEINAADLYYLNLNASSVFVYWFVDCIYQGNTTNYTFSTNYTLPNVQHEILGIIVANMTNPTKAIVDNSVTPSTSGIATTTDSTATLSTTNLNVTTTESSKTDIISYHIINSTYTSDCEQKNPLNLLLSVAPLQNFQKYGYFSRSLLPKGKYLINLNFKLL